MILIFGLSFCFVSAQKTENPNIIIMMVDNLGWGELGCYGGCKFTYKT